jgi:hypothetical protein
MMRRLTPLALLAMLLTATPAQAAPAATDGTDLTEAQELIPGPAIFGDSGWVNGSTLPIAEARPDACKAGENDQVAVYAFEATPRTIVRFNWETTKGQQICRGQVYKRNIDGTDLTTLFTYDDVPDRAADFHFQNECRCFEIDADFERCEFKFSTPSDASFEDIYYLALWSNDDPQIAQEGTDFRLRAEVRRKSRIRLDVIGATPNGSRYEASPSDRVVLAAIVNPRDATGQARFLIERKQGSEWVRYKRFERTLSNGRVSTGRRFPAGTYRLSANYLGDSVTGSDRTGEWLPRSTQRVAIYKTLVVS